MKIFKTVPQILITILNDWGKTCRFCLIVFSFVFALIFAEKFIAIAKVFVRLIK